MGVNFRFHRYAELFALLAGAFVMPRIVLKDDAALWLELAVGLLFAVAFVLLVRVLFHKVEPNSD